MVTVFCYLSSFAQDKPRNHQIEFSGSGANTNINHLPPKSALRELEDDLTKAFRNNLSSHGSLDGVVVPPSTPMPGPATQSKKVREMLERKKDWIFNTPEDLTTGPTAEDLLKLPDYAKQGKDSKMERYERYFDSLAPKRSKSYTQKETDEPEHGRKRDDSNFFGIEKYDVSSDSDRQEVDQIKDAGQKDQIFPGLFEAKQADHFAGGNLVTSPNVDVFGLGAVSTSLEQVESHKAYLKQYQALLDGSPVTGSASVPGSLGNVTELQSLVPRSDHNLSIPSQISIPSQSSVFGGPAILGSVISPIPGLADLSPKGLVPWSQPIVTPQPETPRWAAPTGPTGISAQRPF